MVEFLPSNYKDSPKTSGSILKTIKWCILQAAKDIKDDDQPNKQKTTPWASLSLVVSICLSVCLCLQNVSVIDFHFQMSLRLLIFHALLGIQVSTKQVHPPRVVVRLINGICINLFMKGKELRQAGMLCLTRYYLTGHSPVSIARSPSPATSPLLSISELCTTQAFHSLWIYCVYSC